ncbi:hypothetical protein [Ktedonobacter sp. SOSP1-85]|nr:hypothetical protein [Ktedonobacter sp. SOSP1-85]
MAPPCHHHTPYPGEPRSGEKPPPHTLLGRLLLKTPEQFFPANSDAVH